MIETIRENLARRRALKRVSKRKSRVWQADPSARRLLLVLPADERMAKSAWKFVASLGVDPDRTLPVVPTGEIAYAPVEYIGRVRSLNKADIGRLGLPRRQFLKDVWSFDPDVAISLAAADDLAAALIAGASPAAFRIGMHRDNMEAFFDLMVSPEGGIEVAVRALASTLGRLRPPIIG
jgi:hypothetical protein